MNEREGSRAYRVPATDRLYLLGQLTARVSITSQQSRAFNLVSALRQEGSLPANSRYAIIGFGVTGVSLCAALISKGISNVTIFEAQSEYMYKQLSGKRFVHPSINSWPFKPPILLSDFPFLNWCADEADKVRGYIYDDFRNIYEKLDLDERINYNTSIENIFFENNNWTLVTSSGDSSSFTHVFVCSGYPTEKDIDESSNYWRTGKVPAIKFPDKDPSKGKIIVTGTGDGALIDVFYNVFERFNNGRLLLTLSQEIYSHPELYNQILSIEKAALENWRVGDADRASIALNNFYLQDCSYPLNISQKIEENLRRRFPTIHVIHRSKNIFGVNSSPINRYIFSFLIDRKSDKIQTFHGIVDVPNKIIALNEGGNLNLTEYNSHIRRHGTNKSIGLTINGINTEDIIRFAERQSTFDYSSSQAKWLPDEFSGGGLLISSADRNHAKHYKELLDKWHERDDAIAGIDHRSNEIVVQIKREFDLYKDHLNDCSVLNVPIRPVLDEGFRANSRMLKGEPIADAMYREFISHKDVRHRGIGVMVLKRSTYYFMTLGPSIETEAYNINPEYKYFYLYSTEIEKMKDSTSSIECYTIVSGKLIRSQISIITVNNKDGAFPKKIGIVRVPSASIEPRDTLVPQELLGGRGIQIGERVYKFGFGSGHSEGQVVAVDIRQKIRSDTNSEMSYRSLILVEAVTAEPFSQMGDSGAVVSDASGKLLGTVLAAAGKRTLLLPLSWGRGEENWFEKENARFPERSKKKWRLQ